MKQTQISIIIPVYNMEKYLRETLDSVLYQTFTDYEIICVNDGSTDASGEILASYAQKYDFIKCIDKDNGGLSSARNAGLCQAEGKYIYFLDSDDCIKENALETMYKRAEETQLQVVLINGETFFDTKELEDKYQSYKNFYERKEYGGPYVGKQLFSDMMLSYDFRPQISLYLFERTLLIEQRIRFEEGLLHEDNLFVFEVLMKAERTAHFDCALFRRRIRENSIMTSQKLSRNMYGYYYTAWEILHYLQKYELDEKTFHAACCLAKNCFLDASELYLNMDMEARKELAESLSVDPAWIAIVLVQLEKDYRENGRFSLLSERQKTEIMRLANVRDEVYQQLIGLRQDMTRKNQWLLEKDKKIEDLRETVKQKQQMIDQKQQMIDQKQQMIAQKEKTIQEITLEKDAVIENNKLLVKQKDKQIRKLEKTMSDLKSSISYRIGRVITALPRNVKRIFKKNKKCDIWLIGTPEYGNLGDHQISESEIEFLQDIFPHCALQEITMTEYYKQKESLKKKIGKEDLLFFHGGGNIGNYWPKSEYIRRDAFATWPDNYKIIMPQSIYFTQDAEGMRELTLSKEIYAGSKVILACRDAVSYEFARRNFSCRVLLTPDMVMYSSKMNYTEKVRRNGAMLCLRKDKEKWLSEDDARAVAEIVKNKYADTREQDTVIKNITVVERRSYLEDMLLKIASSEVVVTDRLHGMVFCAITGTPCVVFPNDHHKVEEAARWFDGLDYICFVKRLDELDNAISRVTSCEEREYPIDKMRSRFGKFKRTIRKLKK